VASMKDGRKRKVTIRLDRGTIRKARILAARRGMSLSGLVARQIEGLAGEDVSDESYERAMRQALALLDQGFHLGGGGSMNRDGVHKRG
jgi:hypothetical protein